MDEAASVQTRRPDPHADDSPQESALDEIGHRVFSVAIRRNRVQSAHQGNSNHVSSMLEIRAAMLHISNHVADFSENRFLEDSLSACK